MPLHISEIGVRMAISDVAEQGAPGPATAGGDAGCGGAGAMTGQQRTDLVEECVRHVLATLQMMERR